MGCPSAHELELLLRGDVPAEAEASLGAHLAACPLCRTTLEKLAGDVSWMRKAATETADTRPPHSAVLDETIRNLTTDPRTPAGVDSDEPLDFLQSTDEPGLIGKLGAYGIIEKVASGGMGIVLKARDPALNRIVAIKVLAPALARMPVARARFVREARAAAAVVHEHVVSIHAVEEINGLPYIVMQFIKGRTLAQRLHDTGPLRLEEILRIGAQAASGLAAAHAQGLIHRDIKPGNILLENSVERVTLTDFGLARTVDDTGLTRTGSVTGTPEFMAPEQAGSGPVDQRADLFSLGGVLYAMATGASPFRADSTFGVIKRVCDEEPAPLHKLNPDLPEWLSLITARLLAKNPADRFQTAAEVEQLLTESLDAVRQGREPELHRYGIAVGTWARLGVALRSRRARALAAAAAVILLAWGTGWWMNRAAPANEDWEYFSELDEVEAVLGPTPFAVLGSDGAQRGTFTNLQQAVDAAMGGDIIELRVDGTFRPGAVTVRGRALTFRPATNATPIWRHDTRNGPALDTDAPMALEGIAFAGLPIPTTLERQNWRHRETEAVQLSGETMVRSRGAPVLLVHCQFRSQWEAVAGRFGASELALMDSPYAELRHCRLMTAWIKSVSWQAGTTGQRASPATGRLVVTNCLMASEDNLWLELGPDSRVEVDFARCILRQRAALVLARAETASAIKVIARQCVLVTRYLVDDERPPSDLALNEVLDWQDHANLFSALDVYFADSATYPGPRRGPRRLDAWSRYWSNTPNDSVLGQFSLAGVPPGDPQPPVASSFLCVNGLVVQQGPAAAADRPQDFGLDLQLISPGPGGYSLWRQSPAYAEWRAHVTRVHAGRY